MPDHPITKEDVDKLLREVAKEYRKRNGKIPAEVILVGGAAILVNYGFRDMTYDIDILTGAHSAMKEAINTVGDREGLPVGWMNWDFVRTDSYSKKIRQFSRHYKKFSNVVEFRTVSGEYLIAMKLMSGRRYKNDLSDIIGILAEHEKQKKPIRLKQIKKAVCDLYDDYDNLPEKSKEFIENIMNDDLEKAYSFTKQKEKKTKDDLIGFQKKYPDAINNNNADDIIQKLERKSLQSEVNETMK